MFNVTAPPSVRNMAIYSQDEHYIAVRWQRPYPPYGVLQHYRLIYQICNDEYDSSVIIRNPEPCELWDYYICHTITNLMKDSCYIVKVCISTYSIYNNSLFYTITG